MGRADFVATLFFLHRPCNTINFAPSLIKLINLSSSSRLAGRVVHGLDYMLKFCFLPESTDSAIQTQVAAYGCTNCKSKIGNQSFSSSFNQQKNDKEEDKGWFAILLLQLVQPYAATCGYNNDSVTYERRNGFAPSCSDLAVMFYEWLD